MPGVPGGVTKVEETCIGGEIELPWGEDPKETHEIEALWFGLYTFSLDRVRPILASEGDEDIRCRPWRRRCLPFSF